MRILFVLCGVFGLLFASASKTDAGGVAFVARSVDDVQRYLDELL
jgi:hypothetical protein